MPQYTPSAPRTLPFALLFTCLLCSAVAAAQRGPADEEHYAEALRAARGGELAAALATLAELIDRHPMERRYLYDYIAILGWDERDAEVMDRAAALDLEAAPAYVIEAVGRSARNLGQYPAAIGIYRIGRRHHPGHGALAIGLALALADGGAAAEALSILDEAADGAPRENEFLMARAYVLGTQADHFGALAVYEQVLRTDPAHREAQRGRILTVNRLGAPHLAAAMAEQAPGLLAEDELNAILRHRAAITLRWGRLPGAHTDGTHAETEQAIGQLQRDIARLAARGQTGTPSARAFQLDLMAAWSDRGRADEVIAIYESLADAAEPLPAYALGTAAGAYLTRREPEIARDLYLQALAQQPADIEIQQGLLYAYLDAEDYASGLALAERMAEKQVAWPEGRTHHQRANPDKLRAEITAALAHAFADNLPEAQARLEDLATGAPHNADLRAELGHVYLWRGWPRRALTEFEVALAIEPGHGNARSGRIEALHELRDYRRADQARDEFRAADPDHRQLRARERQRSIHALREYFVEAGGVRSSGAQEGSRDLALAARLYGAPQGDHYRPFVHSYTETARFPEGSARYQRVGGGLEYRAPDLELSGEVSRALADGDGIGVVARGTWHLDDYYSLSAALGSISDDVPLRGRLNEDLSGHSYGLGLDYRASEARRIGGGVQRLDLSDGNRRTAVHIDAGQRLLSAPHHTMTGGLGIYRSTSTHANTSYFSPRSDLSLDLTLDTEWLLHRRYERRYAHRLAIALGRYRQHGYGGAGTWQVRYGHRYRPGERLEIAYGISRARRVYDGAPELQSGLYLTVAGRF